MEDAKNFCSDLRVSSGVMPWLRECVTAPQRDPPNKVTAVDVV